MNHYSLTKNEQKLLCKIEDTVYMPPTLKRIRAFTKNGASSKDRWKDVFDQIYSILVAAKDDVEKILEERKRNGEIKDIRQAMKSIAGNAFSSAIVYVFLQNKIRGNIKPEVFITSRKSQVQNFESIATIYVGGETQKPDCDLIIFTEQENGDVDKCMILSLKTSLRERAGQAYKWKLLMEIAQSEDSIAENSIKEKYGISYNPCSTPLVCFATTNFYEEINNPQQRGMFKFFDKTFIAKPINKDFISALSNIVDFVNQKL